MSVVAMPMRQTYQTEVTEECASERRLWLAVITQAIEDWRCGTLRARRAAQTFLFDDHNDFELVCARAGLDPNSLRCQLLRVGRKIEMHGPWSNPAAA